jgi:hypothetical protein
MKHRLKDKAQRCFHVAVMSTAKTGAAALQISLHFAPIAHPAAVMTELDLAWWGLIVVPVGVAICFGPALLVWLVQEFRGDTAEKDYPKNNR